MPGVRARVERTGGVECGVKRVERPVRDQCAVETGCSVFGVRLLVGPERPAFRQPSGDGGPQRERGGSGPVVFRQAVVVSRVEAWSPERARVSVWHVGVLARDGVAPPQAGWATSSYELVWERGDWKVWSATVVPGPAPILNDSTAPATARELITALTGFSDSGAER